MDSAFFFVPEENMIHGTLFFGTTNSL